MKRHLIALLAAVCLVATACGPEADSTAPTTDTIQVETTVAEDTSDTTATTAGDDATEGTDEMTESTVTDVIPEGRSRLGSSVLAKTLEAADEVSSARFEGRLTMVGAPGSELPGELSMTFTGAYDLPNESSEITMDMSDFFAAAMEAEGSDLEGFEGFAQMFADPIHIITIGETAWIKWGFISFFTGTDGDTWLETSADESGDVTADFGFGTGPNGPNEFLEMLENANAEVEEIGRGSIRGVETTHIRALVDVEELAQSLPADERAELETQLGTATATEFPMEFWIDDDGLLRKYALDLSNPDLLGEASAEITSATMVFEIFDYGQDLGIVPPPADQVVTEDELGGLFGG